MKLAQLLQDDICLYTEISVSKSGSTKVKQLLIWYLTRIENQADDKPQKFAGKMDYNYYSTTIRLWETVP